MAQFTAVIIDKTGLHARPAQLVISEASKYPQSEGRIKCGSKEGNLKSIMNVLSMQIKQNDEITITFDGADADAAVEGVKKVMVDAGLIAG